jgi:hypothetical protein
MNPLVRCKLKVKAAIGFVDKDISAGCGMCPELCICSAPRLHIPCAG